MKINIKSKAKNLAQQLVCAVSFLLIAGICHAQDADSSSVPVSKINIAGRYTESRGIELRFFPDKKSALETGIKNGFIIERALLDSTSENKAGSKSNFSEIARVHSYGESQWEKIISGEKDSDARDELEAARDFQTDAAKKEGGTFDFEKGIAGLKEQKSREDFEYLIFALTALRNVKAAEALGLSYTDNTAEKGKTYLYRILPIGKSDIYQIVSVDLKISAEKKQNEYNVPVNVKLGDTELSIAWMDSPDISGYSIERKNPGENKFTQLNKAPLYNSDGNSDAGDSRNGYTDKNLTNYKIYTYRLFGYTLFGEKVQVAEVEGMPRDLTPPEQPFLPQPQNTKPNQVLVTWKMNPVPAPDLKGFFVARSDKNEGEFKILHKGLLPKDTRSFIDTTFVRGRNNYYLVQAIDTANNVSSSLPVYAALIDSIPPVKPKIISGLIDSLGVVTITVDKNKEPDLMGYRLFKANGPEHEFSVIAEGFIKNDSLNNKIQTVFKDTVTLNSLTPKIYYRVKALDFNFNQSEFSDKVAVVRPDTIPPVPPVFNNVLVGEKKIELHFFPSSSEDVERHIVYRKTDLNSNWDSLFTFKTPVTKYTDTTVTAGITYYYSMRAKDLSGLYSKYASPVYGKPYDTGLRPPVENLSATADKENVILKWEYPELKIDHSFVIYKKNDKGNLIQCGITKDKSYTDTNVGKENYYAVKAVTVEGGQSKMSDVLEKKIEK